MSDNKWVVLLLFLDWTWPVYAAIMLGFATWLFRHTQLPGTAIMAFGFGITLISRIVGRITSTAIALEANRSPNAFSAGPPDWYVDLGLANQVFSSIGHAAVLVGFAILATHLVRWSRSHDPQPRPVH